MHIIRIKYTKMWHHLPALFIWSWLVQSYIFVTIRNQFKNWIIMCQVSKEFSKFLWNVIGFISKIAKDCRRASVLSTTMWIVTRRIYGFVADYVISTLFQFFNGNGKALRCSWMKMERYFILHIMKHIMIHEIINLVGEWSMDI